MKANTAAELGNIISLNVRPRARHAQPPALRQRFTVRPFTNHGGSQAWRVEGTPRHGPRIRENFADLDMARQRQIQLESEFHSRTQDAEADRRATKLTDIQLRLCEAALFKLDCDDDLLPAVDYWLRHGKQKAVAESPRLDEAFEKFKAWLDGKPDENGNGICTLREHSRNGLRIRVNIFCNSVSNLRVNDITPDTVEDFIGKLKVSPTTKDNYRRAVSRFFSWCIARPRRWTTVNPCREIRIEKGERQPPAILTVAQCKALLKAAEPKGLAPFISVCLFAGLRPFEAQRLAWQAVNLKDREIRLEGTQTKTGRPRVVTICDTLAAWLKAYEGKPFFPANWRRSLDSIKEAAGVVQRHTAKSKTKITKKKKGKLVLAYGYWKRLVPINWAPDIMRHTAISHYFRKTGSYGQTAEQFGNSESIIKNHYQGRVSSEDTKQFYSLRPQKKGGRK
jgi:integrase